MHATFSSVLATISSMIAMILVASGCTFAPFGQRNAPLEPLPVDEQPVVMDDPNPLDTDPLIEIACTPQGLPIIETEDVKTCEADPACRVICAQRGPDPVR